MTTYWVHFLIDGEPASAAVKVVGRLDTIESVENLQADLRRMYGARAVLATWQELRGERQGEPR